jgi:hypothetical protein
LGKLASIPERSNGIGASPRLKVGGVRSHTNCKNPPSFRLITIQLPVCRHFSKLVFAETEQTDFTFEKKRREVMIIPKRWYYSLP